MKAKKIVLISLIALFVVTIGFVGWKKWIAPTRIALVNFPSSNTDNDSRKRGKRIGTAYQLENGDIIYLPE